MDRIIEQKKGLKKKHIPIVIGTMLFVMLVGWLLFGDHSRKLRVDSQSIIISNVVQGSFNDYIRLSGQVQPKTSVLLSSSEGGIVEQCPVSEGRVVKAGDVLLVLRNPGLVQQLHDKEMQMQELQNNMRDRQIGREKEKLSMEQNKLDSKISANRSKRTYEQQSSLYEDGLTTREQYIRAKEDYELAMSNAVLLEKRLYQDSLYLEVQNIKDEQSIENLQKEIELARQRVESLNVKATHDGQLGSFSIQLGQNIGAGSMIGVISILGDYKIQVSIDERYIDRVTTGLLGTFERQDVKYGVVVSTVYPEVKEGAFRADFTFCDVIPDNIRVGQTYYINLQLGESAEAVLVPRGNFFSSTGGKWVYVLSPDGSVAVKRTIRIGRQNPQYYEIIEGLQPGERVITSGYDNFGDNEQLLLNCK